MFLSRGKKVTTGIEIKYNKSFVPLKSVWSIAGIRDSEQNGINEHVHLFYGD